MTKPYLTNHFRRCIALSGTAFLLSALLLGCGIIMAVPMLLLWAGIAMALSGGMAATLWYADKRMKKGEGFSALPAKMLALMWLAPALGCLEGALCCAVFLLFGFFAVEVVLGIEPFTLEAFSFMSITQITQAPEGEGTLTILLLCSAFMLLLWFLCMGAGFVVVTYLTLRCTKVFPKKGTVLAWLSRGFGILCLLLCPFLCYGLVVVCLVPATDATLFPFAALCMIGVLVCLGIGGLSAGGRISKLAACVVDTSFNQSE